MSKTTTTTTTTMKFQKGQHYLDNDGDIFVCVNGRTKAHGDGRLVEMKETNLGEPVGRARWIYTDLFVKKLTKKEVAEATEIDRREAEAIADAEREANARGKKPDAVVADTKKKLDERNAKVRKDAAEGKPAATKKAGGAKAKRVSILDAAAMVLRGRKKGASAKCDELVEAAAKQKLWTSAAGKTPAATLYSAIIREIANKGAESRFAKVDKGTFGLTDHGHEVTATKAG